MKTAYVLFREHPNTHTEVYLIALEPSGAHLIDSTEHVEEALQFPTARSAYNYAARHAPLLDNWRAGLR